MDRPALCVLCRTEPVDPRWRPFCSRRCQAADLARWADEAYRVPGPPDPDLVTDDGVPSDDHDE
ncbi:MAG: DNA gyrase inhibitor YacG [Vicinamibacterales bacterium]